MLREEELTNKDIRNARDLTLRQLLRIDNRTSGDTMNRYPSEHADENDPANQTGGTRRAVGN